MQNVYETERLLLKIPDRSYAEMVIDYYKRNENFLAEWETIKDDSFYTKKYQEEQLDKELAENESGRSLRLWIFKKGDDSRIIGSIGFSNIVYGVFLSCHLGYRLDGNEINKGYMTEAVQKGSDVIFNEMNLHRIEANIMPKNKRSIRVVEKLGFCNEGLSRNYLKICGKWEDHIHMVLLNDKV